VTARQAVMTVVETLRKVSARNYSPERAAQPSGCNAAGFRHFRDGNEPILSPARQDQA
jgi:hypothetical protein